MSDYFARALDEDDFEGVATMAGLIEGSATLQARQRRQQADFALVIADAIATSVGAQSDDIEPHVIANALVSIFQSVFESVGVGFWRVNEETNSAATYARMLSGASLSAKEAWPILDAS
jgi:MftR C-terminal domain